MSIDVLVSSAIASVSATHARAAARARACTFSLRKKNAAYERAAVCYGALPPYMSIAVRRAAYHLLLYLFYFYLLISHEHKRRAIISMSAQFAIFAAPLRAARLHHLLLYEHEGRTTGHEHVCRLRNHHFAGSSSIYRRSTCCRLRTLLPPPALLRRRRHLLLRYPAHHISLRAARRRMRFHKRARAPYRARARRA